MNLDQRFSATATLGFISFGETEDLIERRRASGRVSRKLAMLPAHGLSKKIPRTDRYLLTEKRCASDYLELGRTTGIRLAIGRRLELAYTG